MIRGGKQASFLLLLGDFAAFAISLWLTLLVRYGELPTYGLVGDFVAPFGFLFVLWALVFYVSGLYSKRLMLFPSRLPDALMKTQIANIVFAALFFFLIPAFGIAPKTILALYLVVSLVLIFLWRLALYPYLSVQPRRERAVLVASGTEADELFAEVNGNARYRIEFCCRLSGEELSNKESFLKMIEKEQATLIVADTSAKDVERSMPFVYELTRVTRRFQFASFEDVYEEVFDRIPLSQLGHVWFLDNVSSADSVLYASAKRLIDIVGGLLMGIVVLVAAPFIWLANRLESSGQLFIAQERFGQYGTHVKAYKFRSMTKNLAASGEWMNEGENRVTKVGNFLRKTSLDEFPQFINVLKGEISLIGPRNDILGLGTRLASALPYYEARYLVKPGITGWAQINQQYGPGNASPQSVEETIVRLAYDFYYLKHRSLGLDIVIALKTLKRMFFRVSSW